MSDIKIARKIPLSTLLDHLLELFELGVDFVDFEGEVGETNDVIGVTFCKEYMDEEFQSNFDHITEEYEDEIEGQPFDPDNIDDIIL